jgi:two-component system, LytTR family, sensor kinase
LCFSTSVALCSTKRTHLYRDPPSLVYGRAMDRPIALMMRRVDRPALGNGIVLASILGFWLFYVAIVTLRAAVLDFPAPAEMAYRRVIVTMLGIVVTIIYWRILTLFDGRPLSARIFATAIIALPCAVAIAGINYYVFNIYDPMSLFDEHDLQHVQSGAHMVQEIAEFSISRYFFLIAWAALFLALGYAHEVRDSERRAALYAQAAQEAELRALRYQVNPHFLFNTLNSLSALVMSDRKTEAERMIMNLSTFFRTSLSGAPSEDVALADEIDLQRLYLDVESVRFPGRLTITIDLPDALRGVAVPGLILQPLVENAIKHGVATTSEPVMITIKARQAGTTLRLSVTNDRGRAVKTHEGHGIGLANVRDRLAARFGDEATLNTRALPDHGYEALITLQVKPRG